MNKLKRMLLLLPIGIFVTNAVEAVSIGQTYQGGIVFFVDAGRQHGLIASKSDQNRGQLLQWYNGTYIMTNATADGLYAGTKNTDVIISTQTTIGFACSETSPPAYCRAYSITLPITTGNYASLAAANYNIQENGVTACTGNSSEKCYGDWYLPSKYELNLMYQNIGRVAKGKNKNKGGFVSYSYWSSTENDAYSSWFQNFDNGNQSYSPKIYPLLVRAVRAF